jgi:predicted ribosomally synthesized peptide with nif11-like leader
LAKRLSEAQDNESKLEIARQDRFEFDREDAKKAAEALTEEEMESVAGGRVPGCPNDPWCFMFLEF